MSKPKIGFIGIGVMGDPMSYHLTKAGYGLTLYDIDSKRAEKAAAVGEGASIAKTPKAVAEGRAA